MPPASTTTAFAAGAPGASRGRLSGGIRVNGDQAVWLAILLLAAGFRLWALDLRPPHFDEGVNGMFTDQMQHTGFYRYDPTNYHGPLHFYILFVAKCLLGRNLWALRLPEALAGILTVAAVFRFDRFFGRRVCAWAALAMAVSPGFTFFHRYAIHETWLVGFMLLGGWGLLGLWREGTLGALWAAGMGLTGMILTKETYVIHLAGLALAAGCLALLERREARIAEAPWAWGRPVLQHWRWTDLLATAGAGTLAIIFFYSGAGFDPGGLNGLALTFAPWVHKAYVGEGHDKPIYYWLLTFARNEPWALAGLLVSVRYIVKPSRWGRPLRLLALYAGGVFLAYSLVPYKTPWCVIAIAWPFLFLGPAALVEAAERWGNGVVCAAGAALTLWSVYLAYDLNFQRPTDDSEDYVYVQTYDAVREITGPLYDLARENPANYALAGAVLCDSVHPLPWLLGDFSRVGYYTKSSSKRRPDDYRADFLIVSQERVAEAEAELEDDYFKEKLRLRPSLPPVYLYLRRSRFAHLMAGREPEFRAEVPAAADEEPAP